MRYLKKCLLVLLVCLPVSVSAFVAPAQVNVASKEWGDANPDDVQTVLQSVIDTLSPYMLNREFGAITIRDDPQGPVSLYEKGKNGEYVILLNVKGRYWAQLVYQFSHEMCHLMSNYDLAPNNISRQQWFEEALCEAFSLFALDRMAEQWAAYPPYPQWQDYAPEFLKYKQDNLKQAHRRLPRGMKLPAWYEEYRKTLSNDPYAQGRDLNELVANQLLPVFSARPESWIAINYLNLGEDSKGVPLQQYLEDWENSTPPGLRTPVREIREMLLK
ncbi:MAG: hypothetical protein KJ914_04220 [Gammaproteobacteria bacterium]|nr:hypothetical protein [Gammaproteobacteria bacterium]MBU1723015.1 hypothetical protein [Gammaproteobacteria bacterium]MBU2003816.1 hypothetical protein [Gammaproteobacteria bacterium]